MALQIFKIASYEVSSATAATIDFANIPQGYTDLKIVFTGRAVSGGALGVRTNFNGLATNMLTTSVTGVGSGTPTAGLSSTPYAFSASASTYTTNTFSNCEVYITNYTSSNYKAFISESVTENNAVASYCDFTGGRWSATAAITQITILGTVNLAQYSTATLYGIK
jgi:hypothetical protein